MQGSKALLRQKAQNFVFGKKQVWTATMIALVILLSTVGSDIDAG
jgi:hypothetical protein